MNLTDLTRRTRRHLQEAGTASFQDPEIAEQLNRSARTLAAQHALLTDRITASSVSGTVTLPPEVVSVRRVYANSGRYFLKALPGDAPPMPGEYPMAGRAEYYHHDHRNAGTLTVLPGSSADFTLDVLTAGAPMTAGGDEPWNGQWETWHDLIAYHAADRLSTQRGATGAAQTAWAQRFAQRMDEFKMAVAMMQVDAAPLRIGSPSPRRRRW